MLMDQQKNNTSSIVLDSDKIYKQVWTNWAKISFLKLLFWSGGWVSGWLDSNTNKTKSVN